MRSFSWALVLPMFLSSLGYSDKVSLRADNWCPFNCDPKDANPGYMIEIATAALKEKGHDVDYQILNWPRAIAESRDGKWNGIVGAARGDAEDFVFPSASLGNSNSCFFTKADSKWKYEDLKSLDSIVVGVIKDYSYSEKFDKYVADHIKDKKRIDMVAGDSPLDSNVKKLEAGRIGAFIEDENVVRNHYRVKGLKFESLKVAGCVKQDDLYIAFSPHASVKAKSSEYAKLISDKVEAMRKDGSLKTLLQKYGLSDWTLPSAKNTSLAH